MVGAVEPLLVRRVGPDASGILRADLHPQRDRAVIADADGLGVAAGQLLAALVENEQLVPPGPRDRRPVRQRRLEDVASGWAVVAAEELAAERLGVLRRADPRHVDAEPSGAVLLQAGRLEVLADELVMPPDFDLRVLRLVVDEAADELQAVVHVGLRVQLLQPRDLAADAKPERIGRRRRIGAGRVEEEPVLAVDAPAHVARADGEVLENRAGRLLAVQHQVVDLSRDRRAVLVGADLQSVADRQLREQQGRRDLVELGRVADRLAVVAVRIPAELRQPRPPEDERLAGRLPLAGVDMVEDLREPLQRDREAAGEVGRPRGDLAQIGPDAGGPDREKVVDLEPGRLIALAPRPGQPQFAGSAAALAMQLERAADDGLLGDRDAVAVGVGSVVADVTHEGERLAASCEWRVRQRCGASRCFTPDTNREAGVAGRRMRPNASRSGGIQHRLRRTRGRRVESSRSGVGPRLASRAGGPTPGHPAAAPKK